MADLVVMRPLDWEKIRNWMDTQGQPVYAAVAPAGPRTVYGVPVLQTSLQTSNRITVGDFGRYAEYRYRRDISTSLGMEGTDFITLERTFRGFVRVAFVVRQPKAFGLVTITP